MILAALFRLSFRILWPPCRFAPRHNSASEADVKDMVSVAGFESLDALIDATVPEAIRRHDRMDLGKYSDGLTESDFLESFKCGSSPCTLH